VPSLYCPIRKSQNLSSKFPPEIVANYLVQSIEQKYTWSVPGAIIVKPITKEGFEVLVAQWAAGGALTVHQEAAHISCATAILSCVDHDRKPGQPIVRGAINSSDKGVGMPQSQMIYKRSFAGPGLAKNN